MSVPQVWGVEVRYDDENPGVYGPYTQAQAERVAAKIREEVELASDAHGVNHHPHSVLGALASRLTRYDQFMNGQQRQAARRDVRDSEAAATARMEES